MWHIDKEEYWWAKHYNNKFAPKSYLFRRKNESSSNNNRNFPLLHDSYLRISIRDYILPFAHSNIFYIFALYI